MNRTLLYPLPQVYDNGTGAVFVTQTQLRLVTTAVVGHNEFTQTWVLVDEPSLHAVVMWSVNMSAPQTPGSDISSLVHATIAMERRGPSPAPDAVLARMTVFVSPTDAPGMAPLTGTAFAAILNVKTSEPEFRVDGVDGTKALLLWGTIQMQLLPGEFSMSTSIDPTTGAKITSSALPAAYVPVVSIRGSGGGILAMAGARSTFVLQANRRHLALTRIFFFPAHATEDSGYFNGDVPTTYQFSLALTGPDTDWADLYTVYTHANPWLREGPKLTPPGTMTAFGSEYESGLPSASDVGRIKALRSRLVSRTWNEFHPDKSQVSILTSGAGLEFSKANGLQFLLWSNVRMAPNITMVPLEDPVLDYRNFEDSLMLNGSGALFPCWDGFSMNPATEFSFGQFQLKRSMDTINTYNLSGFFYDFYGDTLDSDTCRTYGQFPFYPLQVAEVDFIKVMRKALSSEGRTLHVNCPSPSMQLRHLVDAVSCDSSGAVGNCAFADSLSHRTAGLPSEMLRNILPNLTTGAVLSMIIPTVFYGTVPSPWQVMGDLDDQPTADRMFGAALPLAFRLAEMMPAGGSLADGLWWAAGPRRAATSAAVTLLAPAESTTVRSFSFSLAPHVALRDGSSPLSLLLWDGVGAWVQLKTGTAVELTATKVRVLLGPGTTKALLYLPTSEAVPILHDYGYV